MKSGTRRASCGRFIGEARGAKHGEPRAAREGQAGRLIGEDSSRRKTREEQFAKNDSRRAAAGPQPAIPRNSLADSTSRAGPADRLLRPHCVCGARAGRPAPSSQLPLFKLANLAVFAAVSCKIRLVGNSDGSPCSEEELLTNTMAFMQRMEGAGVTSITLHARTITDSSHEPKAKDRWDTLESLFSCVQIPVVLNGDIYTKVSPPRRRQRFKALLQRYPRDFLQSMRLHPPLPERCSNRKSPQTPRLYRRFAAPRPPAAPPDLPCSLSTLCP